MSWIQEIMALSENNGMKSCHRVICNSSFTHSWISWRNCEQNLLSVALPLTKRLANQQYISASLHLIAKLREVVQEGAVEEQGVHWMPQLSDGLACKDSGDVWCDLVHLFIPSHTTQKTAQKHAHFLGFWQNVGKIVETHIGILGMATDQHNFQGNRSEMWGWITSSVSESGVCGIFCDLRVHWKSMFWRTCFRMVRAI